MKLLKISASVLLVCAIAFLSTSCFGGSGTTATSKPQYGTVQKGSISIMVTGTGNLALTNKQSLSFGQTGIATQVQTSKIAEVNVVAGQVVDKGTVLVKADPKDWQDQITTLDHQLDSAKSGLAQAQATLAQSKNTLVADQYKLAMQQDVADIQTKIDNANIQYQQAIAMYESATKANPPTADANYWKTQMNYYSVDSKEPLTPGANSKTDGGHIAVLNKQKSDLLADPAHYLAASSVASSTASVAQIAAMQASIQQDQANIQQNETNIKLKQNALDDAQSALDDAKAAAQIITAPFKGLITQVSVNAGDIVKRDATLIQISEPEKFQAKIMVTERDVFSVKMDGDALVSFDALSGLNFPAKITAIAPLATVQQGVVNYQVTVDLTSLRPVFSGQRTGTQSGSGSSTPSASARPTGTPSASTARPAGTSNPSGAAAIQAVTLKDGLSATVNIPIQQKDDILMIPNRAIVRQGRDISVQVVKGTATESRSITLGISDGINTEVSTGLNEGEQVVLQSASSSSTTNNRPGGIPGVGGGIMIR